MQSHGRTTHEQEAYELGVEHAKNAASWITDGNTDPEQYARILAMMDAGDPAVGAALPACPNLSGEFADDLTPATLYEEIMDRSAAEAFDEAGLAGETLVGSVMDALCDAYEAGVSETFEPECERILRAAL
jgi:hypothetical protein